MTGLITPSINMRELVKETTKKVLNSREGSITIDQNYLNKRMLEIEANLFAHQAMMKTRDATSYPPNSNMSTYQPITNLQSSGPYTLRGPFE